VENLFKITVGLGGSLFSYLYGGWSMALQVLLALVVLDYIHGIAAAAVEGKVSSKEGFRKLPKKVLIFIMVAVGHLVDLLLGKGTMVQDGVIFFYATNEIISIVENAGRAGLPVPPGLKKIIDVLKNKTGEDGDGTP
jgi:toxin secretion/phage lysis holin